MAGQKRLREGRSQAERPLCKRAENLQCTAQEVVGPVLGDKGGREDSTSGQKDLRGQCLREGTDSKDQMA